jgi:hypothetical protein
MTSMTAGNAPTSVIGRAAERPPFGRLWQVPTFFLGVFALAAVCATRVVWPAEHVIPEKQELLKVREMLKKPDADREQLVVLADEALRHAVHNPDQIGEAHFLLGSAHVLAAEKATGTAAVQHWTAAAEHLRESAERGISDADRPQQEYRLGKAIAGLDEPPQRVIEALVDTIEKGATGADDKARGYGLLASAYLKLDPPNLEAALSAADKQLSQPFDSDALLGPARLLRGEVLLRLARADEARDTLKNVGAGAPAAVIARARWLRACSHEAEGQWADAMPLWQEIVNDKSLPAHDLGPALYHFGLCCRNSGLNAEAERAWADCLRRDGPGDETAAAALNLADLRIRLGNIIGAVEPLERAVRDVRSALWRNTLVPLSRTREVFEAGCRSGRSSGAFEATVRIARLYEAVALPGRAQELRGEAAEAWAHAHAGQPDADHLMQDSGEAFLEAAAIQQDPGEKAERLWRAALRFGDGHDAKRAAESFGNFLTIATQPAYGDKGKRFETSLGEAYYRQALAYRALGLEGAARSSFAQCMEQRLPGRYAYRALYEIALTKRTPDGNWTDEAARILENNLKLLREAHNDRDPEAWERTLYALSDRYFRQLDTVHPEQNKDESLGRAIDCLEEAVREFPNNLDAQATRCQLALTYRLRADQLYSEKLALGTDASERATASYQEKIEEYWTKAITTFDKISEELRAKSTRTTTDERLLAYASLNAADCLFWSGKGNLAAGRYEQLAERFKDPVDRVRALAGLVQVLTPPALKVSPEQQRKEVLSKMPERGRKALEELRRLVPKLPGDVQEGFAAWLKEYDP